ncbi:MAG: molybdopterin oxidoreductase family protein [Clostridium perfringens]|nr:molybdopterin oxidoreductase family protein [Clostridium perfringens]
MEIKQTTCNFCGLACNMTFYVENDKIVKVMPTTDYPVNKGFSCIKGLNLDKQNTKYERPSLPLLKDKNGEMKEIEWNEAFKCFADKIKETQERYGKESVAFISTGQLVTEEMALLAHIVRDYLGANGDGNTRLCMSTAVVAHKQAFGFDAPPYTLNDAELSDTIILIGANPVVAHPIFWGRIKENKEAKKIVIDPRRTETALNADEWIDIKPKADLTLLYTLANVIIENDWINKEYIEKYTENFNGFKEHVKKFTLDNVEEKTGISKQRVLNLAKIIHEGKRVSFWWTMGVNQSYEGVRTAQAIINLALMTGNIGRPGTGANSLTGQCNAMGSRAFSNQTGLYGGADYADMPQRERIAEIMGMDESMLPKKPTIPYNEIIEKCISGEIKVLWVLCTNPRHSWANNEQFKQAVENVDFLVVQDIYKDTDSTKMCDLMLPAVPAIKKEGFIVNTERRLSAVKQIISRKENELSDFEILLGIGEALGMGSQLDNWRTPRQVFEMLKKCSEGMPCDISGVDFEMIESSKGIQWPLKKGEKLVENERRLFEDGKYFTKSGKAKFVFEDVAKNENEPTKEFPYIFNSGRGTVGQWHTQTRTREFDVSTAIYPKESYVEINPKLAQELNIKDNERILITNQYGKSSKFNAVITDNVKVNELYAPIHYIETNALTPSIYDPYSKEPSYKTVTVKIEKLN